MHWRDTMSQPVGTGEFTVEADRLALGPVIRDLVAKRKEQAMWQNDLPVFRTLHATSTRLLMGTSCASGVYHETIDD